MATLLPTLSSDEEDNGKPSNFADDDEESSEGDEIVESFEFGGILVRLVLLLLWLLVWSLHCHAGLTV